MNEQKDKCQTTVNVPLERFKELERIEQAFKEGEPIGYINNKYNFEINEYDENKFYFNEDSEWTNNYTIESWLMDLISREVKRRYKKDKPSLIKKIYNKIVSSYD